MKYFATAIFSFLLTIQSSATIRVVGNGGGLAEMTALSLYSEMPLILQLTMNATTTNPQDRVLLQKILRAWPLEKLAGVTFTSQASNAAVLTKTTVGSPMVLNSRYLYQASGWPRPHQQIAAFLLAGLSSHQTRTSPQSLIPHSLELLSFVLDQRRSLSLRSLGRTDQFHLVQFSKDKEMVFIESSTGTVDLTRAVTQVLNCPRSLSWRFPSASVRGDLSNTLRVVASLQVEWICGSGSPSGRQDLRRGQLLVEVPVSTTGKLLSNQTKTRLFQ